ncbi:hypothetical protein FN846DRAFT_953410 [Sphaerosporella brunnea]|uniref:Uncharacterized protein n=1 Tax=Sphaerosporella brunnea TaxID=1250544 RepID=A0A5J5EUR0_9PEZI|nr:hypothetical protein FN846DRAFT_953410 [Sphaerosporella brunnea]
MNYLNSLPLLLLQLGCNALPLERTFEAQPAGIENAMVPRWDYLKRETMGAAGIPENPVITVEAMDSQMGIGFTTMAEGSELTFAGVGPRINMGIVAPPMRFNLMAMDSTTGLTVTDQNVDPINPASLFNARSRANPLGREVQGGPDKIPRLPRPHEHEKVELPPNWINVYPDGTQIDMRPKVEHKEEMTSDDKKGDEAPVLDAPPPPVVVVKRSEWDDSGVGKKMKFAAQECGMKPPGNTFLKAAKQEQPRLEKMMENRPRYERAPIPVNGHWPDSKE